MAEGARDQERFFFKTVQLLKDQSLGIGSYGAVCKAKCDDLICAAKIIHPTLFDPSALHEIAPQREHRLPIRRFEQECEFMSGIRHPNIVQYLGMYRDSGDTHLPVLLMELMDESLTHFVESSPQPILYDIIVNICHDVTLALSFLHSNNIVHRDLSSNNVLLRGNILAKVTDFGMARLGDINPHATRFTSTMCPGTDVYMPPEAVQDKPVYTEKIDCFSFGVITLQILTQLFPKPGDRMQEVGFNHPGLPSGTVLIRMPEVSRRQNHISQVDPDHPLLPVILDCLKDRDNERPSAHQLCERVADLKRMEKYIDRVRTVSAKEEENQQLRQQLQQLQQERDQALMEKERQGRDEARRLSSKEVKNQQLRQQLQQVQQERDQALMEKERQGRDEARRLSSKEVENQQLRQQLQQRDRQIEQMIVQVQQGKGRSLIESYRMVSSKEENQQLRQQLQQKDDVILQVQQEKDQELMEKERQLHQERDEARRQSQERENQLGRVNQQLQEAEQAAAQFERRVAELEHLLIISRRDQQNPEASSRGKEQANITLKWGEGKRAPREMYSPCDAIVDGNTVYVRAGRMTEIYSYDATTDHWCQLPDCVKKRCSITVINGWLTTVGGVKSNELFSLTIDGRRRMWSKKYPPMPTRRSGTTSLCTGAILIVAGGWGEGGVLSTVEVMNTENHQWSTAADLPQPMYSASATVCGDRIYMLGGGGKHDTPTKSVYTCSVSTLLRSCVQNSLEARLKRTFLSDKASVYAWRRLADLPVVHSTCEFFHGRLLVFGGEDDLGIATTAVYTYSSTSNSWEVISHMKTGRFSCFTAVLPNNQLIVVGGKTDVWTFTSTVELASVINIV